MPLALVSTGNKLAGFALGASDCGNSAAGEKALSTFHTFARIVLGWSGRTGNCSDSLGLPLSTGSKLPLLSSGFGDSNVFDMPLSTDHKRAGCLLGSCACGGASALEVPLPPVSPGNKNERFVLGSSDWGNSSAPQTLFRQAMLFNLSVSEGDLSGSRKPAGLGMPVAGSMP
mmetsp:Transcript_61736/g.99821  ORF Transcript_61736/g.99821 Transcript_61736/m.99821 type:complete len:172 (+) Transcript_61736:1556-2071(+)